MKTEPERLRELLAINRAITGASDYDGVLRLIVEKARVLTDARASLLLLGESGAPVTVVASIGIDPALIRDFQAVLDERINAVLQERLSLRKEDDVLAVPMIVRGSLHGILAVIEPRSPDAELPGADERLLSALADQAGIALGNAAHLRETEAALATSQRLSEELARSEARIRDLIEVAPDAFFLANLDARLIEVNQAACQMLGYTHDELLGMTMFDLLPTDDAPRLAAARDELLTQRRAARGEWTFIRKDRTLLPVEVSANILPDGRWQAFARDVSERRRLQAALRASHADLVRAQSVAMVGSWRLDLRHDELKWSDETYRIFGVAPGTRMTYEAFLACVHPDDRELVSREWTAALNGRPYDIEHRVVADGTVKWVRERASLEFDEHHRLVGGIGIAQDITARKRDEQALREEKERTELALRGADLAAWDWNIATDETVFSPRWEEMRGFPPMEVKAPVSAWMSIVHPEDWPRVQAALDDYLHGRVAEYETEHRVRTRSGEWIWILDRGKIFARDAEGRPIRMVGTALDITPRKRADEKLRLAEARSSGILSISADAIISIDEDQRITMFNEGAEKIFGYAKAEVIGAPLDRLLPERLRAAHRQHVARFAAGAVAARQMGERAASIFGLRKNGDEFPAEAAISKLDVSGSTILTVALRDVTERKRIEKQQQFLAEVGAVFAESLDYEQTLATVGQLAVRELADWCIVEIVEEGARPRRLKAVSADPSRASLCAELERLPLERSRPYLGRSVMESRRPVLVERVTPEVVASFAQSPDQGRLLSAMEPRSLMELPLVIHGRLFGVLVLVSSKPGRVYGPGDVPFAEALAERAALAIENGRLYRDSVQASQLRDEVLRVVAHDLRNPLSSILMMCTLAQRRLPPQADGDGSPFARIERSAKRMNRLIQDLLDISTIEAGHLGLDRSPLSPAQLVSEAVEAQRLLAESASLHLGLELAAALPDVWGDQHRLLEVLENLIGNATKFTPAGGHITVGASPREGEVLFWVTDTGCGIAPEAVARVFDRFWKARRGDRKGAGLGLPITRGIVEGHGGRIWVESTPGQGSTFFFTIPQTSPMQTEATPAD